jgi:hypothetical protein
MDLLCQWEHTGRLPQLPLQRLLRMRRDGIMDLSANPMASEVVSQKVTKWMTYAIDMIDIDDVWLKNRFDELRVEFCLIQAREPLLMRIYVVELR